MGIEYTEKVLFKKRQFRLLEDHLRIEGRNFRTEIPLKEIRTEKDICYFRDDNKTTLAGLPGVILLVLTIVFGVSIAEISILLFWSLLGLFAVLGVCGFLFAGREKCYVYHYKSGPIAFGIAETDPEHFSDFCREIEARIDKLNET